MGDAIEYGTRLFGGDVGALLFHKSKRLSPNVKIFREVAGDAKNFFGILHVFGF
jgi:hypothetical protein